MIAIAVVTATTVATAIIVIASPYDATIINHF